MSNFLGSHQKILSEYFNFYSEYLKLLPEKIKIFNSEWWRRFRHAR